MDLLLTGSPGFLGSQLLLRWLLRSPTARAACLIRGSDDRLISALNRAAVEAGSGPAGSQIWDRITVLRGELDGPAWVSAAAAWMDGPAELVHCAADLSFREGDRAEVWRANVGGTSAMLDALAQLPAIRAFNYVSTAYVAGDREGDILERETARPVRFNNPYEESKWTAEQCVRTECARVGRAFRILRPSIIIAHSATRRTSSPSGFYKVAETLMQLGQARAGAIRLPIPHGTTLDLLPVDTVVDEMLALIALGSRSEGKTFHITSAAPLDLADVLRELTPMSGISIGVGEGTASRTAALVMRSLHHYLPYFSYVRRFARDNAAASGAPAAGFRLDVDGLRTFLAPLVERGAAA